MYIRNHTYGKQRIVKFILPIRDNLEMQAGLEPWICRLEVDVYYHLILLTIRLCLIDIKKIDQLDLKVYIVYDLMDKNGWDKSE